MYNNVKLTLIRIGIAIGLIIIFKFFGIIGLIFAFLLYFIVFLKNDAKKETKKIKKNSDNEKIKFKVISTLLILSILMIILLIPIPQTTIEKYNITEYINKSEVYFENETYYSKEIVPKEICKEEEININFNKTEWGVVRSLGDGKEKITIVCTIYHTENQSYNFTYSMYAYQNNYAEPLFINDGIVLVPPRTKKSIENYTIVDSYPPYNYYLCKFEPISPVFCFYENETIWIEKEKEVEKIRITSEPYQFEKERSITSYKKLIDIILKNEPK